MQLSLIIENELTGEGVESGNRVASQSFLFFTSPDHGNVDGKRIQIQGMNSKWGSC